MTDITDPDLKHKRMYADVREDHPEIPAWDDLTEEQKVKMRGANNAFTKFMNDLGDEIRGGKK